MCLLTRVYGTRLSGSTVNCAGYEIHTLLNTSSQVVSDDFILINTHCVNTRTCLVEVSYLIVIAALNMFTGIKFCISNIGFHISGSFTNPVWSRSRSVWISEGPL